MSSVEHSAPGKAVIVGGSSGIGAATARSLVSTGYSVHLIARRQEPLERLSRETGATWAIADVSSAIEIERALDDCGPVSLAVYAAGALGVSPVAGHPTELWESILATNLTGAFIFARAVESQLESGARVVFISSVAAAKGQANQSAYAASKGGLTRFAESFAAEMEPRGIGVHLVNPGPVATPMLDIPGTSPFQLDPERVAEVIAFLGELPPEVVLREVTVRAVVKGPFAVNRHSGQGESASGSSG